MTAAWQNPDHTSTLPARDEDTLVAFYRALPELERQRQSTLGTLAVMRESMSDSILGDHSEDPAEPDRAGTWCVTHERDTDECRRIERNGEDIEGECVPELKLRRSDPTFNAANTSDPASADYREHMKDMATIARAARRMHDRAERYPASAQVTRKPAPEEGPGDDWCSNCYLDSQYFEPITMQKRRPTEEDPRTEKPYYTGLCKWCGDMKALHGMLPTRALLDLHHRNVRITEGHWQEERKRNPTRTKDKKDKKGKKPTRTTDPPADFATRRAAALASRIDKRV